MAGGVKGGGEGDVMMDAETGAMSFEDGGKGRRATCKEYRQPLTVEKRQGNRFMPQNPWKEQACSTLT